MPPPPGAEAAQHPGRAGRARRRRLGHHHPRVGLGEHREAGRRVVEPVHQHEVRAALERGDEPAHRRRRGGGRGRARAVAEERDPVRALRAHPVHRLRVRGRRAGRFEELVEPGGGLHVERERQGGERPAEVEHRDVAPAPGRLQRRPRRERGGAAAARAGEGDHAPVEGVRRGRRGAGRGLAHRGRGDRLHQVVAHPAEQDFPAEPGGVVRAERDHDGPHLAHRGQLVDGAGRVGDLVEVHEDEPRRVPLAEARGGGTEVPGPHLGVPALGEPLAQRVLAVRVRREGEGVDLGEDLRRGGMRGCGGGEAGAVRHGRPRRGSRRFRGTSPRRASYRRPARAAGARGRTGPRARRERTWRVAPRASRGRGRRGCCGCRGPHSGGGRGGRLGLRSGGRCGRTCGRRDVADGDVPGAVPATGPAGDAAVPSARRVRLPRSLPASAARADFRGALPVALFALFAGPARRAFRGGRGGRAVRRGRAGPWAGLRMPGRGCRRGSECCLVPVARRDRRRLGLASGSRASDAGLGRRAAGHPRRSRVVAFRRPRSRRPGHRVAGPGGGPSALSGRRAPAGRRPGVAGASERPAAGGRASARLGGPVSRTVTLALAAFAGAAPAALPAEGRAVVSGASGSGTALAVAVIAAIGLSCLRCVSRRADGYLGLSGGSTDTSSGRGPTRAGLGAD